MIYAAASDFPPGSGAMTTKLTSAAIEAWAGLVRTEKALVQKVEERLKAAGFPPLDWYHVLYEVDRAPKGMLRQSSVQDRTQLAQYNVCRLVDRLQREGLVERRQCRLDGRNNVLVITAKGRSLRRAMWPAYAAAVGEHFGARLSEAEAEQLLRLLGKLAPA
ncbi:MAG TPA: MarR family winged helix-turn-helix transcriptional regulator [Hyphomicrobiaceae bacterium]|jgi:DNA-binding MarR family transcriptional regulator